MNRSNTQIRDQKHEMLAEGAEDFEPTKEQIEKHVIDCGYQASNIVVFFSEMFSCYRWTCDIAPLNNGN